MPTSSAWKMTTRLPAGQPSRSAHVLALPSAAASGTAGASIPSAVTIAVPTNSQGIFIGILRERTTETEFHSGRPVSRRLFPQLPAAEGPPLARLFSKAHADAAGLVGRRAK